MDRIRELWDWRLEAIERASTRDIFNQEMDGFARIFASDLMDEAWAIDRLLRVLAIRPGIGAESVVIERLARLAKRYPAKSVEAISRILMEGSEHPDYWVRSQSVRSLVDQVKDSGDVQAWQAVHDLVNGLMAKSVFGAHELLSSQAQPQSI